MRTHLIPKRSGPLDWSRVPLLAIDNLCWTPEIDISATAQICYDAEALYLRLAARESAIRAQHTGPLGMPCEDSCLEFFFSPIPGDSRYLNFEFNPNGCLYLGFGTSVNDLIRLIPETPFIHPQIERTADGWMTTYAIPYSFIRQFFPHFSPAPGKSILANCYKCGEKTPKPHYIAWNPIPEEPLTFHCPQYFGRMYFG